MYKYITKRLLQLIFVIIGVSFFLFVLLDKAPGDVVWDIVGEEASMEDYLAAREELGFNDPVVKRYARYMLNLLRGNLGYSYKYKMPVWTLYTQRVGNTFRLAFSAIIVSTMFSIPVGIYIAKKQGTAIDNVASAISVVGLAAPNFWVGIMLILLFSLRLGWFRAGGFQSWTDVILPAITLGTAQMAIQTRMTRSSMIDVIRQDYLLLARSKGCSEASVIKKHGFKNALIPILTTIGTQFTNSLGGSVVTETVFSWPGIGKLTVDAIKSNDFETVTGTLIMTSIITCVILLVVDILYAFVDPRIKARYK